jgi:alpha-L-fucosidase
MDGQADDDTDVQGRPTKESLAMLALPAVGNEWYPRNMYRQGTWEFEHHVKTFGPHARYVVPVAEHHDGFAWKAAGISSPT